MKNQRSRFTIIIVLLLTFLIVQPVSACTIFMANSGDDVLAGNNEDWHTINSYIQFIPGGEEEYGQVYFGTSDWYAEGGMNSEGLFYDAAAIPTVTMNDHPEKSWPSSWAPVIMLESCSNVSEAIQMFNSSRFETSISWQLLVADGNGDAAVFTPGADGEWHYILKDTEDFLVVTNFNLAISPDFTGCVRYNTATNMLEEMGSNLTVEYFTTILDAVHNPTGGEYDTIYSNICDLVNKDIYLFYSHDFSKVVMFNLLEELQKGYRMHKIADLFPDDEGETEPSPNQPPTITISALVGGVLIGLVAIGLLFRRMQRKNYP